MDAGAFLQENRRWLGGCAIGLVLFVVAWAVIGSMYDSAEAQKQLFADVKAAQQPMYSKEQFDAARKESEALQRERQRLQKELSFVPTEPFAATTGAPDGYLALTGSRLRGDLLRALDERAIEQPAANSFTWPTPSGVDDIRGVLYALELLQESCNRLIAAHEAVRGRNPEAIGLRAITRIAIEDRKPQRAQVGRAADAVDVREHIERERAVTLHFLADAETTFAFFESLRAPDRTLLVQEPVSIAKDQQRPSEPLSVKVTLLGMSFRKPEEK